MHTFGWKTAVVALSLCTAATATAQTRGSMQSDSVAAPPECANLSGIELSDCVRAFDTLNGGGAAGGGYGASSGGYGGGSAGSATTTPGADMSTGTSGASTSTTGT